MKKIILFALIMFGTLFTIEAQDLTKDIIGTWKLETVEIDGQKLSSIDVFGAQAFQKYAEEGKFNSIIGDQKTKGTYTLSDSNKTINIKTKKGNSSFKVLQSQEKNMTLEFIIEDNKLILNYLKE